ncbi:MAG: glycoside hydrolase family 3 C-terminal domain-containing protein [Anaerolineales bacterium]
MTSGLHSIQISYTVPANAVLPVSFRFAWSPVQATIDKAAAAAEQAPVAIVFVDDGNTSGSIRHLGPYQDRLVQAVTAANPNTILVLNTGNPVLMPWLGQVKAMLEMWYPGQEGGTATAKLLLGQADPGGKLPITFPASTADTPFAGHPERLQGVNGQITWSEGLFMGYRWYDQQKIQPLFEFGYGLSYTQFEYSQLNVTPTSDGGLDVSFRVQNIGSIRGDEVPQVYVGPSPDVPAGVQQAVKKLVQFERITLLPNQWRELRLHVTRRDLSYWSTAAHDWAVGTGIREVFVGASSRDIRLSGTVEISQ